MTKIDTSHGTTTNYVVGFVLSLLTTLSAYWLVRYGSWKGWSLVYAILALATLQLIIQVVCFLHLGREKTKPYWNSVVFAFMLLVVLILVIGSIWIMKNLNYHMTPTDQVNQYLKTQDGL